MSKRITRNTENADQDDNKSDIITNQIKSESDVELELHEEMIPCTESLQIETLHDRMDTIEKKLDKVIQNQTLILTMLKQLTRGSLPGDNVYFPLKTDVELQKINKDAEQDLERVVNLIKNVTQGELVRRFSSIIDENLIKDYNIDGMNSKKAFKQYVWLNKALYEAHKDSSLSELEFTTQLRAAFKKHKLRIIKRKYDREKRVKQQKKRNDSTSSRSTPTEVQF